MPAANLYGNFGTLFGKAHWRVDLAAMPMCHLHLIRPRKRVCYDEDNALKDQDNRQGFTAAPRNAMECGDFTTLDPRCPKPRRD
jgi:hypothetical protein